MGVAELLERQEWCQKLISPLLGDVAASCKWSLIEEYTNSDQHRKLMNIKVKYVRNVRPEMTELKYRDVSFDENCFNLIIEAYQRRGKVQRINASHPASSVRRVNADKKNA